MDPLSSSASSSTPAPESRPQAGPLPRKRGEIGFSEEALKEAEEGRSQSPAAPLPDRHPEDRQAPAAADSSATPAAGDSATNGHAASASVTSLSTTSTNSVARKKRRILAFLDSKKVPSYGGLRLTTLLAFTLQVLAVAGTIVGWAFAVTRLAHQSSSSSSSQPPPNDANNNGQDNSGNTSALNGASTSIFVYVVFGVATLVQLLFLERRVFRLRAERYSYLHPGEILPSARTRAMDTSLRFSPWNRPPLPTYAAALAQSGVGTGDVEDHIIAVAPPPAYGNTRGSTFLLSGFLRASLRAQRPLSTHTQASQNHPDPDMTERPDRPVSYVTVDEDWEEIQNAERARVLEETLSALERPAAARA